MVAKFLVRGLTVLNDAMSADAEIELYSRVQALERAITRVQNILADLAISGAKLGGLDLPEIKAARSRQGSCTKWRKRYAI